MLDLCKKFNALSCKKASLDGAFLHPNLRGDWYLVQINSLPKEDIYGIVSDIHHDRHILIQDGSIVRCSGEEIININDIKPGLSEVIDSLENKIYTFLLFDNKIKSLFNGQPVIFAVNPCISRSQIPYHRHLNNGFFRLYSNSTDTSMQDALHFLDKSNLNNHHLLNYHVIPESICYIHDVEELDVEGYCRQEVAYATMVGYAFRNEIFLKYYEKFNEFFWLGPETPFPSFEAGHLLSVNQDSECHCGSRLCYKECHFDNDFQKYIGHFAVKSGETFLNSGDIAIAKQMVIETQKHFTFQSKKLIYNIVELVKNH